MNRELESGKRTSQRNDINCNGGGLAFDVHCTIRQFICVDIPTDDSRKLRASTSV